MDQNLLPRGRGAQKPTNVSGKSKAFGFKNKKPKQQKQKKERITKNATNRTLKKNRKSDKSCDNNSHSSRKFNLRDAVIYSEILTPKFKQTDME